MWRLIMEKFNMNITLNDLTGGDLSVKGVLSVVYPNVGKEKLEYLFQSGFFCDADFNRDFNSQINILKLLNNTIEKFNISEYTIKTLTKNVSVLEWKLNGEDNVTYIGGVGSYKGYVTHLINGLNKIKISSINYEDIVKYKSSDEEKVFNCYLQPIFIGDMDISKLSKDAINKFVSNNINIDDVVSNDVANYLLHILQKYLPSNVITHFPMMKLINDDEDEISEYFNNLLFDLSDEYMEIIFNNLHKDERVS